MKTIELRKIEGVNQALLEEITTRLVQSINPRKIVLFGSYAYGKAEKHSDIDILIIMDKAENKNALMVQAYEALAGLLIPKDIVIYTQSDIDEWSRVPQAFITSILKSGKVLYEKQA